MESHYRPEIDGLRAIAVLSVVLFHARIPGIPGGYVGVDIFFVISGYLITRIIASERQAGRFSLVNFYERRARRILPALFAVCGAAVAASFVVMLPLDQVALSQSLVAVVVFMANIFFWRQSGYFGPTAETLPLLHTWSLAVEEQFYLIFPLFLLLLYRRTPRLIVPALLAMATASLAVSQWAARSAPAAAFYLPPSRAFELLTGCALAVTTLRPTRLVAEVGGLLGLSAISGAVFLFSPSTPFPGIAALLPILGAAALIWSGGATVVGRGLSTKPMVGIGLISYSLYLWHWPALVFAKIWLGRELHMYEAITMVGLALGAAFISWRWIETPFRRRSKVSRSGIAAFSLSGAVGLVLVSGASLYAGGWPNRFAPEAVAFAAGEKDTSPFNSCSERRTPEIGPHSECYLGDPKAPLSFVLWGDSHAFAWAPAMDSLAKEAGRRGIVLGFGGCPPIAHYRIGTDRDITCPAYYRAISDFIRRERPELIILSARWSSYYASQPDFGEELRRTISALESGGLHVTVILQPPEFARSVPRALASGIDPQDFRPSTGEASLKVRELIPHLGSDRIIDPVPTFCQTSYCTVAIAGKPLYSDAHHLSVQGALWARGIPPGRRCIWISDSAVEIDNCQGPSHPSMVAAHPGFPTIA